MTNRQGQMDSDQNVIKPITTYVKGITDLLFF